MRLVLMGGFAGFGVAAVLLATEGELGLSRDSIGYLTLAKSNLDPPAGFPLPARHWPPGYPLILNLVMRMGTSWEFAALLVSLTSIALSTLLVGMIADELVEGPSWASVVASGVFATSMEVLNAHEMVWSEGPFVFLILTAMYATLRAQGWDAWRFLALFALALIPVVRFVGVAVAAVPLARRRWGDACVPLTSFVTVSAFWGTNRTINWHPPGWQDLALAYRGMSRWVGPDIGHYVPLAILVLIFIAWARGRSARRLTVGRLSDPVLAFAVALVLVTVGARTLADPGIPFNYRILLPLQVALIIIAVVRISPYEKVLPVAIAIGVIGLNVVPVARHMRDGASAGWETWGGHSVVKLAKQTPDDVPLYSNMAHVIWLHASRPVSYPPSEPVPDESVVVHSRQKGSSQPPQAETFGLPECRAEPDAVLYANWDTCRRFEPTPVGSD